MTKKVNSPGDKKLQEQKNALLPKHPIKSLQYDLFSHFLTNDKENVSNSIEIWESIPKYFLTPRQVEKLRSEQGLAETYEWDYAYHGQSYKVTLQPALIKQANGRYKAFFPGATEELVEEALKKILADQHYGLHDPNIQSPKSWVRFTLRMLHKELKARGKTRSLDQIKHAIAVMSRCVIQVSNDQEEEWQGTILQDLVTVGRKEYLEDSTTYHAAQLPLFISQSINALAYRQFNTTTGKSVGKPRLG